MRLIAPMLATPGEPPEQMDGAWAAEMKHDGCRLLVAVGGDEPPVLWTRNLNVVTSSYPEVAEALTDVFGGRGRIVFDGEVVALVQGRPSFARLQKRMTTPRPSTTVRRQVPVTYLPFDVLRLDGGNLMAAPYLERRAALTDLGHELHGAGLPLQVLPHWVGVDSAVILKAAQNASMEGALFKKVSSTYQPGKRARSWRKVLLRTRSSAVRVPGGGAQRNMVGALVLGAYDEAGVLRYVGHVGPDFRWPCAASSAKAGHSRTPHQPARHRCRGRGGARDRALGRTGDRRGRRVSRIPAGWASASQLQGTTRRSGSWFDHPGFPVTECIREKGSRRHLPRRQRLLIPFRERYAM